MAGGQLDWQRLVNRLAIRIIERNDVRDEVELYFQNNPQALARRHHALVDAEALRCAFIEVVDP